MKDPTGLPDEQKKQLRSLFEKHPEITEAVLFGSRAKGGFREGSDIDIALKGRELNSLLLVELNEEYEALYLPWKLDLIIHDRIKNPALKEHIQRVGILFYKRQERE